MKLLRRVRQKLQNKLSLSSKIFLRRLFYGSVRPFARVAGRIKLSRRASAYGAVPAAPKLNAQNLQSVTVALAEIRARK